MGLTNSHLQHPTSTTPRLATPPCIACLTHCEKLNLRGKNLETEDAWPLQDQSDAVGSCRLWFGYVCILLDDVVTSDWLMLGIQGQEKTRSHLLSRLSNI